MVDPLEALKAELERFGEANDAATGALPPHAQHRPRHRRVPGRLRARHLAEDKIALASATFARSGLSESIELLHDDAGRVLRQCAPGAYDLVFLDSERTEYPGWWRTCVARCAREAR